MVRDSLTAGAAASASGRLRRSSAWSSRPWARCMGAQLAQAGDRRGEGCRGGRVMVVGGQASNGQVAFGLQNGGQVPRLPGAEQGK
jgi:hypothetical protein